jgi:hypothetical protein
LDSAESASRLIGTFAEIYSLDGLLQGKLERETWRKSLSDFAKTTTSAVSSVTKAVPVGIAKASGDVVIRAANQIEAKRSPREDSHELSDQKSEERAAESSLGDRSASAHVEK